MSNEKSTIAFLEAVISPINKKPTPPEPDEEEDLYDMEQHRIAREARGSL